MRFLIQECNEVVESNGEDQDAILGPGAQEQRHHHHHHPGEGLVGGAGQGGDKGKGAGAAGKASEPFAYVSAAWHPGGELFACGDNSLVAHWQFQQQNHSALSLGTFAQFGDKAESQGEAASSGSHHYVTCCAWHPRGETLACAISQGSFKLVSRQGRVEKTVGTGTEPAHVGACIGVRWNLDGTALATCGEDGKVKLWSKTGMLRSTLASESEAVYGVAFSPDSNQLALCSGNHVVVKRIGGTNAQRSQFSGTSGVVVDQDGQSNVAGGPGMANSRSIRWKAHAGVVLSLDWSVANGKIVTGGEDGKYKVWDAYGRLLYQSNVVGHEIYNLAGLGGKGGGAGGLRGPVMPVTSVRWRPSGESFAVGTFDMLLLCDESGWVQHKASPNSMQVLSGREGPGFDTFASLGRVKMPSSVLSLAWSADGTQLACTNGNGSVFIVMILGEVKESGAISLEAEAPDTLRATFTCVEETTSSSDLVAEDKLHFGSEKILATSVGFGKVVVITQKQVYVYSPPDWHSPHVTSGLFTQEMPVKLLVQGPKCMATTDTAGCLKVISYDTGRVMCQPKFQGMRAELMSTRSLALADDCVAVVDHASSSVVRVFDTQTGKPLAQKLKQGAGGGEQGQVCHHQGGIITEVGLSLVGGLGERKLCFVDSNRDLYLSLLGDQTRDPVKLCTMCDSFGWSTDSSALCCVSDGKLLVWCIPDICFLDQDLLPLCTYEVPTTKLARESMMAMGMGDNGEEEDSFANDSLAPRIQSFERGRIITRHGNGALVTYMVPLAWYSLALEKCVQQHKWPKAVHLCRTVGRCEGSSKGEPGYLLWACLAALSLGQQHIETAKTAYASLGLIDKVQFMNFLKDVPSDEGRAAELALFKGVPAKEVEGMLLQSGLHYRAIKLNIRMFHWERALELALKQSAAGSPQLVQIVLWHRRRYLLRQGRPEHLEPFMVEENNLGDGVELVDTEIKAKIQQEKNKEVQRPAGMIRRQSISVAY
ncbi:WD40 repeat domain-containing protein [Chloropicon primus]|nr:WD40 repeat domain-containing protein [Chloropicon primus]